MHSPTPIYKDHTTRFDALILDLGGVLLDLEYERSADAFKALAGVEFDTLYAQAAQVGLFDRFEVGGITADEFREGLRSFGFEADDEVLDHAWNAMLLDLPLHRLNDLEQLGKENSLYLLSNTNRIHIESFESRMKDQGLLGRFKNCFKEVHYSSVIGRRKPHPETFSWVLQRHGLKPERVLFIDDTVQHVQGATEAGLQAYHLRKGEEMGSLFFAG